MYYKEKLVLLYLRIFHQKKIKCDTCQNHNTYTEIDFLIFSFLFCTDIVKLIIPKLFQFCFSFSFLSPFIVLRFPLFWKRKMKQSLLCVTLQALERFFKVFQSNQQQKHLKMQKKFACVGRGSCLAFILLSPDPEKYLTLNISKQLDFSALKVYKILSEKQNNIQKKSWLW